MTSKEELKSKVCSEIERRNEEIIAVTKAIWANPETGFREVETSRLVAQKFAELGLEYRDGLAITGVKALVKGSGNGPTIGILGELDALLVPDHPNAHPRTGAAHACGHHTQIGVLIGVAAGLVGSGVFPSLSGRVALMAVPAEEYIEIDFRNELRKQGKLSSLGGKAELIKLGEFDDVDMAIATHSGPIRDGYVTGAKGGTSNGAVAKLIQFIGRGSHAAGPYKGINALNAATIALSAIHTQRETFQDDDAIRVHPIITRGGDVVNAVPSDVRVETFVRGKTVEAILDANEKVDRALRAGALAVGAKVRITTLPAYFPVMKDPYLRELYTSNAVSLLGEGKVSPLVPGTHAAGSSDLGDLSCIMPVITGSAAGAVGSGHGSDFLIEDYELAVINPAKIVAMMVIDLLADDASKAKEVLLKSKPLMTKQEYLASAQRLFNEGEYEQ